jgi:hypothetical protein
MDFQNLENLNHEIQNASQIKDQIWNLLGKDVHKLTKKNL